MKKTDLESLSSPIESTSGSATSSGLVGRNKTVKFMDASDDEGEPDQTEPIVSSESDHLLAPNSMHRRKASGILRKFSAVGTPEFNLNVMVNSNSFAEGLYHDQDQFLSNKYEVLTLHC